MINQLVKVLAMALLAVSLSSGSVIDFATTFGPEAVGATGSGSGFFQYDDVAQTLSIDVNWTGLSSLTTAAHIHCCVAVAGTGTAGVATTVPRFVGFPTGVADGTYNTILDLALVSSFNPAFVTANGGTIGGARTALIQGMLDGKTYFNIHTSTFPGGEIRGFLAPVPEPGTILLSGLGLLGLIGWRRSRTR